MDALIIGHRGDPTKAVENSIQGFESAYRNGADGIEFDVQRTRDGQIVVMHDDTLDRTTTCVGSVGERDLSDLASCELQNGEPVRTLSDALDLVGGWFDIMFLEIKVPDAPPTPDALRAYTDDVVAIVRRSGLAERIVIISYDETVLRRVAEHKPEGIHGGWDDPTSEAVAKADRYDLDWVLVPVRTVEPWMGTIVRGLDRDLAIYSANSAGDYEKAHRSGVRAMLTDSVRLLCALEGRSQRDLPAR